MRRFLLSCAILVVLAVPAAAGARAATAAKPGYLVIRKAVGDGGANGRPVATLVVQGFVLGRVSQEAEVDIFHLPLASGQGGPAVKGTDVSSAPVRWYGSKIHGGLPGRKYTGSNFRFRATGGLYRVVVRGSGVYIFAGGRGKVWLQGSSVNKNADGTYSVNGSTPRSMPTRPLKREIGRG
ncbi:MAG TPA: hypothetical protein VFU33_01120 [Gaiellaceae bacterium]|nr:hypothetical protein [Gaiellaceae bacterium]